MRQPRGSGKVKIQQWDGGKWVVVSDWIGRQQEPGPSALPGHCSAICQGKGITPGLRQRSPEGKGEREDQSSRSVFARAMTTASEDLSRSAMSRSFTTTSYLSLKGSLLRYRRKNRRPARSQRRRQDDDIEGDFQPSTGRNAGTSPKAVHRIQGARIDRLSPS